MCAARFARKSAGNDVVCAVGLARTRRLSCFHLAFAFARCVLPFGPAPCVSSLCPCVQDALFSILPDCPAMTDMDQR